MALFRIKEYAPNNKHVIFLLPGWHNKAWMFWIFAKLFQHNGFYCLLYEYDDDILSPNTKKTVNSLAEVRDDILIKIRKFKKDGYNTFAVFGTSLGSVISVMVANKSQEVDHVILNTIGFDISETVWSWDTIFPYFKKNLFKQGYTLEKLQTSWKEITPKNNLDRLMNKKLLIYLTKKDEVIPYYLGEQFVDALKNKRYNPHVVVNKHLNHVLTGAYNLLNAKVYFKFLKK